MFYLVLAGIAKGDVGLDSACKSARRRGKAGLDSCAWAPRAIEADSRDQQRRQETILLTIATWLINAVAVYAAIGLAFAIVFVWKGAGKIDPAAIHGTIGFRLLIIPGTAALWPILARRWLRGERPPEERNAHRDAAREAGR